MKMLSVIKIWTFYVLSFLDFLRNDDSLLKMIISYLFICLQCYKSKKMQQVLYTKQHSNDVVFLCKNMYNLRVVFFPVCFQGLTFVPLVVWFFPPPTFS